MVTTNEVCSLDRSVPSLSQSYRYTIGIDPGVNNIGVVIYDNAGDTIVRSTLWDDLSTFWWGGITQDVDDDICNIVIERPFSRFNSQSFAETWAWIGAIYFIATNRYCIPVYFASPRAGNKALGLGGSPTSDDKLNIGKLWGLTTTHEVSALGAILAWRDGNAKLCDDLGAKKAPKRRTKPTGSRRKSVGKDTSTGA